MEISSNTLFLPRPPCKREFSTLFFVQSQNSVIRHFHRRRVACTKMLLFRNTNETSRLEICRWRAKICPLQVRHFKVSKRATDWYSDIVARGVTCHTRARRFAQSAFGITIFRKAIPSGRVTQFHAVQLDIMLTANYRAPCVRVSITNASAFATWRRRCSSEIPLSRQRDGTKRRRAEDSYVFACPAGSRHNFVKRDRPNSVRRIYRARSRLYRLLIRSSARLLWRCALCPLIYSVRYTWPFTLHRSTSRDARTLMKREHGGSRDCAGSVRCARPKSRQSVDASSRCREQRGVPHFPLAKTNDVTRWKGLEHVSFHLASIIAALPTVWLVLRPNSLRRAFCFVTRATL